MIRRPLILVATLALLVSACSGAGAATKPAGPKQKVTVMLDWTPNTNHSGIYIAKQRGYYDRAGLDVNIVQPGEQGALQALGAGSADFAITFEEELVSARGQGVPAVSVGAILSTNTSSLLFPSSEHITRPKDLEGKTYGGSGSDLEKALVSSLVRCDGGDPSKVKFADVGDADYRNGFAQHQYDFIMGFDGWETIHLRQQGVAVDTIPFNQHFGCIPDWYTPVIATTNQKIMQSPALVHSFMNATAHGYRDAISDPTGAANALLAGAPELDATLVRASATYLAKYYAKPGQDWGLQDPTTWARFQTYLQSNGLIEKPVKPEDAFTNQFLPRS